MVDENYKPKNKIEDDGIERHRPALGVVEAFLQSLNNADKDGRILVTHNLRMYSSIFFRAIVITPYTCMCTYKHNTHTHTHFCTYIYIT